MAKKDIIDTLVEEQDKSQTFNPLLVALRDNDKKNLFTTNVNTVFMKTGFPLFDYYFGSVINIHDKLGRLTGQEGRVGQAAGTFNMIIGNSGSGKALPDSELLLTPDENNKPKQLKMSDVTVGTKLYSWDMRETTVFGVYPQGKKRIWKISIDDGIKEVLCSEDHLWTVMIEAGKESTVVTMDLKTIRFIQLLNVRQLNNTLTIHLPVMDDNITIWKPIYEISPCEYEEECTCIYVDDPTHLFMTHNKILTHNTTLAAQMAANIIRQYKYANVIHFDCENRFDLSRCETITRLPASFFDTEHGERYMIRSGMVGLDTIQEMIVKTYVSKMKLKKELVIDSGYKDEFGKEISMFQPTIIIIDSITTVLNETFNPDSAKEAAQAEQMRGNTEGARDAKTLKGFFKDVLPMCKEANITIYGINHINQNMSMNAFLPVAKQQNYLKQDEIIPGGKTMIYYPFNIVKLTAKPSDDFSMESDGFAGHIVMVEPIKSSSNQSGNNSKGISFELVFTHKYGFDSLRSLILYGRDNGLIEGNKIRMKFKGDDSFTFSFKDIYKEAEEKPIWKCIKEFIIPDLNRHLPFIEPDQKFDDRSLDY